MTKTNKTSGKEIIEKIKIRINDAKKSIESDKKKIENTSDEETIQILKNSIRASRISIITLEELLKSI